MRGAVDRMAGEVIGIAGGIHGRKNARVRLSRTRVGLRHPCPSRRKIKVVGGGFGNKCIQFGAREALIPVFARPARRIAGRRPIESGGQLLFGRLRGLQYTADAEAPDHTATY